jgi:hypothetical protein
MFLYSYLPALPAIPAHLTKSPILVDKDQIGFTDDSYSRWAAKPELVEWLKENISDSIKLAGVQVISSDVPLHCDKRKWALNYIIEPGGDNVSTGFYKLPGQSVLQPPGSRYAFARDEEELCVTSFKTNEWHILNTNVLHKVAGITGKRVAITIGLNSDNPFDKIKGYQGLTSF